MSKLNTLRDEKASELNEIAYDVFNHYPNDKSSYEIAVNRGWDAHEALNLPVLFMDFYLEDFLPAATFGNTKTLTKEKALEIKALLTPANREPIAEMQILYDYWINNIYTP